MATAEHPALAGVLERHAPEFTGSGSEYFRIWIVNLLLSIVTLGIYSAWATVRNRRYLYGSMRLMGAPFDFHATGLQVLKGRVVVVGAVVGLSLAEALQPGAEVVASVLLFPLVPWIVVRARRFRLRNTSWRNVRFDFAGSYRGAAAAVVGWPLLGMLSLGAMYPFAVYRQQRFSVDNMRFGDERFRMRARPGFFYTVLFGTAFAVLGLLGIASVLAFLLLPGPGASAPGELSRLQGIALGAGGLLAVFIGYVAAQTLLINHAWSRTRVGEARLHVELDVGRVLWIRLSNVLLIVVTAGLFTPWARVRRLRYELACTTLVAAETHVSRIEAAAREDRSALGDEMGGAFDLDVGIA